MLKNKVLCKKKLICSHLAYKSSTIFSCLPSRTGRPIKAKREFSKKILVGFGKHTTLSIRSDRTSDYSKTRIFEENSSRVLEIHDVFPKPYSP